MSPYDYEKNKITNDFILLVILNDTLEFIAKFIFIFLKAILLIFLPFYYWVIIIYEL